MLGPCEAVAGHLGVILGYLEAICGVYLEILISLGIFLDYLSQYWPFLASSLVDFGSNWGHLESTTHLGPCVLWGKMNLWRFRPRLQSVADFKSTDVALSRACL
jgi:hypothetical protein